MAEVPFGTILRQWRERNGLTLEAAATAVEILATTRGIPKSSKKVPRTHASLSRWENGHVEIKRLGLELLAAVYGTTPDAIQRPPPPEGSAPTTRVEVPAGQARAVEAFIEALKQG